ncbi:MAG TPA: hydroxymethylpyrimidine/phosphomethylpyrimidine kinase [Methylococcaceae bacterium]|nr:hydroxymethylpyrimidine/phosphomethylpyrimidine kinase [Methylococcaceae bacterium]
MKNPPPVVLCLSGHDPSGGAGIQADIETLSRLGNYPCTVITAMTVQDTRNVRSVLPQREEDFLAQARLLIDDLPVAAVKIGLLGSSAIARAVWEILRELRGVPVVLDPILAAGGGTEVAREDLIETLKSQLLPLTTVLTPNTMEARRLAGGRENLDECADELLRLGCDHVLITGTHDSSEAVINRWYGPDGMRAFGWERLPHSYHGSGCTLASALAGFLALGLGMEAAVHKAQKFTWLTLDSGFALGKGQYLPNRLSAGEHCGCGPE